MIGEIGVKHNSIKLVKHTCGTLFIQKFGKGFFSKPTLETVYIPKKSRKKAA